MGWAGRLTYRYKYVPEYVEMLEFASSKHCTGVEESVSRRTAQAMTDRVNIEPHRVIGLIPHEGEALLPCERVPP